MSYKVGQDLAFSRRQTNRLSFTGKAFWFLAAVVASHIISQVYLAFSK